MTQPNWLQKIGDWFKPANPIRPLRILMTELGNNSSGDEAICLGATQHLEGMGAQVTCLYRVSLQAAFERAGVAARHIEMPLTEEFAGADSLEGLLAALSPDLHYQLREHIAQQDVVAIAPGCKFLTGYNTARALATSAVALSLNKPVILLHQSLGPVANPQHVRLLQTLLPQFKMLLIRDQRSLQFLNELSVFHPNIVPCGDIVFGESYTPAQPPVYDLGLNLRFGFNGHVQMQAVEEFIKTYLQQRPAARILAYSTTREFPTDVQQRLGQLGCQVEAPLPAYPNYVSAVGQCAINISDSFHGILFSFRADRPVVYCQPDFDSWKLLGIQPAGEPPLEVLPGLVNSVEVDRVLSHIRALEEDPQSALARQQKIVQHNQALCNTGWQAVQRYLESVNTSTLTT